ncbi:SusC/RagA family TonB-linked outer membrane protein [Parapedobacter sp. DT-150]|uniref:SusC/RagA family TonB-linked outer membrane protein n=1 Tax=Parapedobacter sp. DT-150 TaxID=3396162 RepID=UPI003F1E46EE
MKKLSDLLPIVLKALPSVLICCMVPCICTIQTLQAAPTTPIRGNSNLKLMADITIQGVVVDGVSKEPLAGVSIKVEGKTTGVTTDEAGRFTIRTADNAILIISYIGYKTQRIKANADMSIALEADATSLEEVVVSGYTTQNRAEFTGSSSHISGAAIATRPVSSFDQALAGQAAGVKITSSGGSLNAAPVFRIRGTNSIQLSSYPLIIIDGITSFTGDVGNTAENNPLSTLDPNDIESMEVLKDASATAIYGSRAANGVVVITTKKGKQGQARVNYDGWVGRTTPPKLMKVLGAEDYIMIKNEALANIGSDPAYFLQTWSDGTTVRTDWYDYVYQTGTSHNHSLNISGASESTSYFVSLGYTDQEGFMVKNTFERKNARLNLDHKLTKNMTIGTNLNWSNSVNDNLTHGVGSAFGLNNLAREAMVLPPNLSPFNEDGSYNIEGAGIGYGANTLLTGYYNPLPQLEHDQFTSESRSLLGTAFLEYEFVRELKFKINYSLNDLTSENRSFNNPYQAGGFAGNGQANNAFNKNRRTAFTTTLNYVSTIGEHHGLNILAGYEEIHTNTNNWGVTRRNLNDRFFEIFEGSYAETSGSSGSLGENGFRSYFTSVNYDYKKKYLLSGSFRKDGFSGLAAGLKYGDFGGASVGWNLSEEAFFKQSALSRTISSFKIRASYGQVGNVNIGNYPSLSLYSSGVYNGLPSLAPSQSGNPELQWETSKKMDIGFNIGFLNDRITLDADYYHNNIDGMILDAQQAPSKGIPDNSITTNVGLMYNRGLEFNIDAHVVNNGRFTWNANFNISTLKNRVTSLANENQDIWSSGIETSNITRVGYQVGAIYVVRTTGVNPANGLRKYINRNGEEVQYNPVGSEYTYLDGSPAPAIDLYGDGVVLGNSMPTYFGGFNNTLTYGNVDLLVNIVYSGGNKMYNGTRATLLDNRFFNNSPEIMRRWTHEGQITDVPKLHYNDQQASGSVIMHSANVEDGSYIKLSNVSLGYRFPQRLYSKAGISSIRLYASAGNFILYTKYTGSDPEISADGDSNTGAGRDKNSVPAGRSYTLGLNIGF